MHLPLSVLDLIPVPAGSTSARALSNSRELARHADELGFLRYWVAEHHNTRAFVSTAPELAIAMIARETKHLRVGSGGVMLPNHSPLRVAESFRTLEALFPGRIDLGLGRAPGTDPVTALALRRCHDALGADDFPDQLHALLAFSGEDKFYEGHPFERVHAEPHDVPLPPIWILGSSGFGARMAAATGRGFAFAHHFSPEAARPAMHFYRQNFTPSKALAKPQAILGVSVVCADTEEEADTLATTHDLVWVRISRGERMDGLPSPVEARAHRYTPADLESVRRSRAMTVVGNPEQVRERLIQLADEMGADELIITSHIHDHAARLRSYLLIAKAVGLVTPSHG